MAEAEDIEVVTPENQDWIDLVVVRRTKCSGVEVKPGDKIKVPAKFKVKGVYPVRWWRHNKKAALNAAEAKKFAEAVYDGGPNKQDPSAQGKLIASLEERLAAAEAELAALKAQ